MNTKFENIEGVLYYDQNKQLYNFPYILEFQNEKCEIDYIFHVDDFENEENMLKERNHEISKIILHEHFLKQFEILQEICLEEENDPVSEEIMNEINERLDILYYLYILVFKLNTNFNNEVINSAWSFYDELMEMFVLLEDFFTGIRIIEFIQRKTKIEMLDKALSAPSMIRKTKDQ